MANGDRKRERRRSGDVAPMGGTERERLGREFAEEIEAHIAMRAQELVASGMSPEDARAEAERRFGDMDAARRAAAESARRRARRQWWAKLADEVQADVRHALRMAHRSPSFTALAVSIFAFGVGLSTTMFAVADHVLIRPLPYPHPSELVAFGSVTEKEETFYAVSMGNWADWRTSPVVAVTGLYRATSVTVAGEGDAFQAAAVYVAGGYFETLKPRMILGRSITETEGQNEEPVVVVSEDFWRRVLGADPHLGQQTLVLNGVRMDVVGVLARGQELPAGKEVWLPQAWHPTSGGQRNNIGWYAVARLAPGVTASRAREALAAVAAGIRARDPEGIYSWGVGVEPLRKQVVADATTVLRTLIAAVVLVLVAAWANLAGLGLARSRRRTHDVAVRLSLGARRGRVIRQILAEYVVLAMGGGALGMLLAWWGLGVIVRTGAYLLPRASEIIFDGRVAAFGLLVALLSGILAGMGPALRASVAGTRAVISGTRGAVHGGRGLPGAIMVGVEVALAVALLVNGSLLMRSLRNILSHDLGYDPTRVVTLDVSLDARRYDDPAQARAYREELLRRVRQVPAVEDAAVANSVPTGLVSVSFIDIEGTDERGGAAYRMVSDDYFDVLGIPVLEGRSFDVGDVAGSERVGLVNQAFAQKFWPDASSAARDGQNALGKRFRAPSMEAYFNGGTADWIRVVGVVGNALGGSQEFEPRAEVFVSVRQSPLHTRATSAALKLRLGAPDGTLEAIRQAARDLDPDLAVTVQSLEGRVQATLSERRLVIGLLGSFAATALLLVTLGVYGLLSFAVADRTRELAVRAALGLSGGGIVRLVLVSASRVLLAGLAGGAAAGLASSRLLRSLLVEIGPEDPVSYLGATVLILVVTLMAALVPAVRAARLDPVEALRKE